MELTIDNSQKGFVANNKQSLAEASFEDGMFPLGICADETMAGFWLYYYDDSFSGWYLSRFMIGKQFQGRGYGKQAALELLDYFKKHTTQRNCTQALFPRIPLDIHQYAGDKDITVMYYLPNETFDEAVDFVKRSVAERGSADQTDFEFVILYDGRIIGGCDADLSHSQDRSYATLGWIINKSFRNHGFACEAVGALLEYAFTNLEVEKVYAQRDINNPASFGVMKRIGMKCINDKETRTYPKTGKTSGAYTCLIAKSEWQRQRGCVQE